MRAQGRCISTRLLAGTILGAAITSPVHAQENTDEDVATQSDNVIIVTAQKREERLIDVPVSIAVTDGDTLNALGFSEATDLQFTSPGLGLGDSNTPRGAGFRVRGVGTAIFADGIEQSVGSVVDGVPLARAGQGLADLIDIERVEVLRGPQGMLFGRNASAGLINIVTKRPDLEDFGVEARVSYGEDNDFQSSAAITGPIADNLGFRLTGYFNSRDGFITDIQTGDDLNDREEYGFRGSLLFDNGSDLEVIVRADYARRDNQASVFPIRALAPDSPLLSSPVPGLIPPVIDPEVAAAVGPEVDIVSISGEFFNEVEDYGGSVEINYDIGDFTLTSITAYREWQQIDNNDADNSTFNILDVNVGSNDLDQFSQEIRLTSPADEPFSFVIGGFYYESTNSNEVVQTGSFVPVFSQLLESGIPVPIAGTPFVLNPGDIGGRALDIEVSVRDIAIFGQAEYDLTDRLTLIAGGRYTWTEVEGKLDRFAPAGTSPVFNAVLGAPFAPLSYDLETDDGNLSFRFGARYELADDVNFFATVSRGYKGPGFDTQVDFIIPDGVSPLEAALVAPEIPTNYEVGIKAARGAFSASLVLFRTEFDDFQAQVFETPPGATLGSFGVTNAGELVTQGFELELGVQPTQGLSLSAGLAYADTEFDEFLGAACPRVAQALPDNPCSGGVSSFDASGLQGTNAPQLSLTVNGRYDQPITDNFNGFLQVNSLTRSDNNFTLVPAGIASPYEQDGFTIVNASIGVQQADGLYGVSVFANNLFDTNFVTSIFDLPFGGAGDLGQFVTRDAERLIGVQAFVSF